MPYVDLRANFGTPSCENSTKSKDSVFTKLFSDVKYLRQLYDGLYKDGAKYRDEDFKLITLENVLVSDVYNDLGFMVGDRLIVLVEAQSTFNPNMALRLLIYGAHAYQDCIKEKGPDIYGRHKIQIPEPDFILVYTGIEKLDEYKSLNLSDLYMQNDKHKLNLRVDIFSGTEDEGNILCQYIGFCRKFDEFKKGAKTKEEKPEALLKTINYCKEHDILKEFLREHEREVMEMRMTLYTQEEIDAMKLAQAMELGRKAGMNEGILLGEERGRTQGRNEGISIGRNEGISIGEARGEARGLREGILSTVKKMLSLGAEVAFVQKATGLSIKDIQDIADVSAKDMEDL